MLSKCQLLLGIKEESLKQLAYISSQGGKGAKETVRERLQNRRIFMKQSLHPHPHPVGTKIRRKICSEGNEV